MLDEEEFDYALNDDIPPEPYSQPVPEGSIRLFHVTKIHRAPGDDRPWHRTVHEHAQNLRTQGIRAERARGESYGEPSVVWASAGEPIQDFRNAVVVEFHHPVTDLDIGSPIGADPETHAKWLEERRSHVTLPFGKSVEPENILAVHEPWHSHYRHAMKNPDVAQRMRAGKHDSLIHEESVDYGPTIVRIKAGK